MIEKSSISKVTKYGQIIPSLFTDFTLYNLDSIYSGATCPLNLICFCINVNSAYERVACDDLCS